MQLTLAQCVGDCDERGGGKTTVKILVSKKWSWKQYEVEEVPISNVALCKSYSQRDFSASYSKDYTLIVKVLTVIALKECQLSIEIHPNCTCPIHRLPLHSSGGSLAVNCITVGL